MRRLARALGGADNFVFELFRKADSRGGHAALRQVDLECSTFVIHGSVRVVGQTGSRGIVVMGHSMGMLLKRLLLLSLCLALSSQGVCAATESSLTITPVGSSLQIPATLVRPDG